MSKLSFWEIVQETGLRPDVCGDLLDKGWSFHIFEGVRPRWIAPTADITDYIPHEEPNCDSSCGNLAPHRHGLPCHKNCKSCEAVCHPECPAYKE